MRYNVCVDGSDVKICDCTLRDGGYQNDWNFGAAVARGVVSDLLRANCDFVEVGFMRAFSSDFDKTLFGSFPDINRVLPENAEKSRLLTMIDVNKFDADSVCDVQNAPVGGIRVIFKKKDAKKGLEFCKIVKNKGFSLFINPTFVNEYSSSELAELALKISEIAPFAFSVVDSQGALKDDDILRIYNEFDAKISPNTAVCFHLHDNLNYSSINVTALTGAAKNRKIIVDTSLSGVGRGAGNLDTVVLAEFFNKSLAKNYDVEILKNLCKNVINPIMKDFLPKHKMHWYLAAFNGCHPDYAGFLAEKGVNVSDDVNDILKRIPPSEKFVFDKKLIEKIYTDFLADSRR